MSGIVTLMVPIFAMIGIGSLFVQRGWFPAHGLPYLNRFVMVACVPIIMFSAVTSGKSLAAFAWTSVVVYGVASLFAALVLWAVLRFVLSGSQPQSIILALGGGSSNSIFLGFPIAQTIIPDSSAAVFAWVLFAEVAIVIPIISNLALLTSTKKGKGSLQILINMLVNPVLMGVLSGLAFLLLGLSMPGWLEQTMASVTSAAAYVALFAMGGALLQFRLTRSGPRVLALSIAKLIVHPLAVGLCFVAIFGGSEPVVRHAILFAAMPIFSGFGVYAAQHEVEDAAASAVVLSTILGAFSVTVLLSLMF